MASGRFASSLCTAAGSGYYRYIEVVWSSANHSGGNSSVITWTAYSRSPDASTTNYVYAKNIIVTINGTATTVIGATAQKTFKDGKLGGGTITVSHDGNGKKTVNVSIQAQIYTYGAPNSSYTGAITMSPNPVYTLSIHAGAGSGITVNRTACAGSGGTGILSAGAKKLYHGDTLKIMFTPSANYSIDTHTVNGTTFTSGNAYTVTGDITAAATATPLKSIIGATDANIGSTSVITVTKYNASYTHTITYSFGSLTGVIAEKSPNTSIAWTVPPTFYAQIPRAKTGTCTLTCTTYNGGASLGSSNCVLTVTAAASNCEPDVSSAVTDINTTTQALTGNTATLIRYKSTALCTLSATPKNSGTISSLSIAGSEVTGTTNDGVTTATKSYPAVSTAAFTFAATDSRGYCTTVTKSPTMVAYINLTCNPVLSRSTPTGSSIAMTFAGDMFRGSFGACSNMLTLRYRYKESGGSYGAWQTVASTNIVYGVSSYYSGAAVTVGDGFDYRKDYVFQIQAADGGVVNGTAHTLSTVTKTITVNRGIPVFDWGENDFNINVPLMLNNVNILNIMYPVGAVYMHGGSELPEEISHIGNWTSIATGIHDVYAWKRIE
jgi:hypothetical protein